MEPQFFPSAAHVVGVQHTPFPSVQTCPAWQQVGEAPLVGQVRRAPSH